jgi:hypothetical protein
LPAIINGSSILLPAASLIFTQPSTFSPITALLFNFIQNITSNSKLNMSLALTLVTPQSPNLKSQKKGAVLGHILLACNNEKLSVFLLLLVIPA